MFGFDCLKNVGIALVALASDVDHLMTDQVDMSLVVVAHIKVQTDTGEGHTIRHDGEQK